MDLFSATASIQNSLKLYKDSNKKGITFRLTYSGESKYQPRDT